MRYIEEEEAVLSEYFPLRAKNVSAYQVDEEETKFGLPKPDMSRLEGTPKRKHRDLNPYD